MPRLDADGRATAHRPWPRVRLAPWTGPWSDEDADSNFKQDVALYARADPLVTLRGLSRRTGIPVGALARYVLARWSSGATGAVLELGPSTVQRMREECARAEQADTDTARLVAYERLRAMISWVGSTLDAS